MQTSDVKGLIENHMPGVVLPGDGVCGHIKIARACKFTIPAKRELSAVRQAVIGL